MLKNEKYMGVYIFKPGRASKFVNLKEQEVIRIENGVPAIVTKEKFLKVQQMVKANKRSPQTRKARVPYILSSKVFCGKCGGKLYGHGRKSKAGKPWNGYQCSTRKNYKTCDFKELKKELLEELILKHLEETIFCDAYIQDIAQKIFEKYLETVDESIYDVEILKKELFNVNKKINNFIKAIEDGMYHPSMKKKMDELELQKIELINIIADASSKNEYNFKLDEIIEYLSIGKNLTIKDIKEQQAIINSYIQRVDVHEDKVEISLYFPSFENDCGYENLSLVLPSP